METTNTSNTAASADRDGARPGISIRGARRAYEAAPTASGTLSAASHIPSPHRAGGTQGPAAPVADPETNELARWRSFMGMAVLRRGAKTQSAAQPREVWRGAERMLAGIASSRAMHPAGRGDRQGPSIRPSREEHVAS